MNVKIRKGDTVEVISGSLEDKGKRGEVINVQVADRRVVVQGVNIMTKHQKQTQTSRGRTINPGRIKLEDVKGEILIWIYAGHPAVDDLGQDSGAGGFSYATGTGKQEGLSQLIAFNLMDECFGNMTLTHHIIK